MSLTPREARILELWDTGLSMSQMLASALVV